MTIDEAWDWLECCMQRLPREIFNGLNGGVNLLPDRREDADGLLTMGMYIVDETGRRVEIYYGSFEEAFAGEPEHRLRRELDKTLRHELTHHIEDLAGDHSLEKWDEVHREELLTAYEPLEVQSILFVDHDDAGLAPLCCALFQRLCQQQGKSWNPASGGLREAMLVNRRCAAAGESLGVHIAEHRPVVIDRELLSRYDVVLCMSAAAARQLAAYFPEFEEKIMCLGARDHLPPRLDLKWTWKNAGQQLNEELELLLRGLRGEEEADD